MQLPQYFPGRLLAALGVATILTINIAGGREAKPPEYITQSAAPSTQQDGQLALQTGYRQPPNPGYGAAQVAQLSAPPDPDNYCLRTRNQITLRPGEHFTLRDILDEILKDAQRFSFVNIITDKDGERTYNFSAKNIELQDVRIEKDGNTYKIFGTLKGKPVSYRIEFVNLAIDSVTAAFGPEQCFPSNKVEPTGV